MGRYKAGLGGAGWEANVKGTEEGSHYSGL